MHKAIPIIHTERETGDATWENQGDQIPFLGWKWNQHNALRPQSTDASHTHKHPKSSEARGKQSQIWRSARGYSEKPIESANTEEGIS